MVISILKKRVAGEQDVIDVRQRAHQIAGLLNFNQDYQVQISTASAELASNALARAGGGEVEFLLTDDESEQVLQVLARYSGPGVEDVAKGLEKKEKEESGIAESTGLAGARRFADHFKAYSTPGSGTTVIFGKKLPPDVPPVAGKALSRIIGELTKRSRPKSFFMEIQQQNKDLLGAMNRLAMLNKELDSFAHTVSHDLKNPLCVVKMASELIREELESGEEDERKSRIENLVEMIEENLERSEKIVDGLLSLAKTGPTSKGYPGVDVLEIVKDIVEEKALIIEKRGARIEVMNELGEVTAHPIHIYQLFSNLINNAIRHNDNENPVVRIEYLGENGKRCKRYLVRDNGPGIPPEHLEDIFKSFFKGNGGGTGIGLAIAKKIIGIYNGNIKSYNDNGACFEFTICRPKRPGSIQKPLSGVFRWKDLDIPEA